MSKFNFAILMSCAVGLTACQMNPLATGQPNAAASAAPASAGAPGPSCERLPTMSNAQKVKTGAALGTFLGVLVADATGASKGRHYATGALGGALVGALAGSAFKSDIDVEEQPDGSVKLKIPGSVMFSSGQSALSPGFQSTLASVSAVVKRYCSVNVRVVGHTDSVGAATANQALSERRAASVQTFMQSQGLERAQLVIEGKGDREPIASNADESGRQQNRRVEIFLRPPAG